MGGTRGSVGFDLREPEAEVDCDFSEQHYDGAAPLPYEDEVDAGESGDEWGAATERLAEMPISADPVQPSEHTPLLPHATGGARTFGLGPL